MNTTTVTRPGNPASRVPVKIGQRYIVLSDGDAWHGCVIRITGRARSGWRCRLTPSQRRLAAGRSHDVRTIASNDLF